MNVDRVRLQNEAAAQLAAETVRLEGIQNEIIAHLGPIPDELADDLAHQKTRHDEAVALVLRLS